MDLRFAFKLPTTDDWTFIRPFSSPWTQHWVPFAESQMIHKHFQHLSFSQFLTKIHILISSFIQADLDLNCLTSGHKWQQTLPSQIGLLKRKKKSNSIIYLHIKLTKFKSNLLVFVKIAKYFSHFVSWRRRTRSPNRVEKIFFCRHIKCSQAIIYLADVSHLKL